ncbi:effector-associated constant component EACC1 [Actinoplanes awajinensis]|uniref:effector-associated constant component EACC1 n=1 Tax=Actinoplanes awajinensis TaxID=135946 RepID=UPI0012FA9F1F|nr:hypothetical protein [Actinoplanes awajinensis]
MKIMIEVLGDDCGDELHDLREWLRDDADLRGSSLLSLPRPPADGEMNGGVPAALEATIMNKELVVALAGSIGGWLTARAASRRTRIRVRRGEVEVEIDTTKLRDAEKIARTIQEQLNGVD